MSFVCTQFECQPILFDPYIGPNLAPPIKARVDLRVMAMKNYSAFPKAPTLLVPHYQIVLWHIQDTSGWFYPSEEMQSVYFTAPADKAGCGQNGHNSSFNFHFLQPLFQASVNRSMYNYYDLYHSHLHVPQPFQISIKYIIIISFRQHGYL